MNSDFCFTCPNDKSKQRQKRLKALGLSDVSSSLPLLHISLSSHLTLPNSSLISPPFSHVLSSVLNRGELNTSVSSSALCHPPPPPPCFFFIFPSSFCPPHPPPSNSSSQSNSQEITQNIKKAGKV